MNFAHPPPGLGCEKGANADALSATACSVSVAEHIEAEYVAIQDRLARTLRSSDDATESLHEAYIKLRNGPVARAIASPTAYLVRVAINMTKNTKRRERFLQTIPLDDAMEVGSEEPDPARVAMSRRELDHAVSFLDQLPLQRRTVFMSRWRDNMDILEIASALGIHKRTVQKELARAERHLRESLSR